MLGSRCTLLWAGKQEESKCHVGWLMMLMTWVGLPVLCQSVLTRSRPSPGTEFSKDRWISFVKKYDRYLPVANPRQEWQPGKAR